MPRARPVSFTQWWHGLPWNGLFWVAVLGMSGGAAFFAIGTEVERGRRMRLDTWAEAQIADGELVKVALILNGDELVVEDHKGRRSRLRMLSIHSFDPVVSEREITAFGDAALRFLEQWVLNKQVAIFFDRTPRDARGRYLGYLHLEEIDINRRMVEEGVSMVYTEFATVREQSYLIAEQGARRAGRGLWGGRKSRRRVFGLRTAWAAERTSRDGSPPVDPLLEEQP